jgi:hypothetical protein
MTVFVCSVHEYWETVDLSFVDTTVLYECVFYSIHVTSPVTKSQWRDNDEIPILLESKLKSVFFL